MKDNMRRDKTRFINKLHYAYPVKYNIFGSSEIEMPFKTSALFFLLSVFGHNREKSLLRHIEFRILVSV